MKKRYKKFVGDDNLIGLAEERERERERDEQLDQLDVPFTFAYR